VSYEVNGQKDFFVLVSLTISGDEEKPPLTEGLLDPTFTPQRKDLSHMAVGLQTMS
jgi:hypothetical protein